MRLPKGQAVVNGVALRPALVLAGLALVLPIACGDSSDDGEGLGALQLPASLQLGAITAQREVGNIRPSRDLFLVVSVTVSVPAGRRLPVAVTPPQFSLVLAGGTSIIASVLPSDGFCTGDLQVEPGGSLTCLVGFDIATDATFTEVRFLDAELAERVSDTTSINTSPITLPPDTSIIGDLTANELGAVCDLTAFPPPASPVSCPRLGFEVGVHSDPGARCAERLLPAYLILPELGCLLLDVSECTVGDYVRCVDETTNDLCGALETSQSCFCAQGIEAVCP